MAVSVHELELDLDAFQGPFDLLLSLVLREELPLGVSDPADGHLRSSAPRPGRARPRCLR
jgi:hypothetical protein